jgi:hypothetical protein
MNGKNEKRIIKEVAKRNILLQNRYYRYTTIKTLTGGGVY